MTDVNPASQVDLSDPLPEPSMIWRRWATFIITGALLIGLEQLLLKVPAREVLAYAQCLMLLMALLWLFYFGGASATDVARVIQSAGVVKELVPHFLQAAAPSLIPAPSPDDQAELPESAKIS